ncbi:MAG: mannose-1-phosphate guanylyltransferase [Thermoguttaceae bacterium]|jgi:mannose-1-phosphate guanylyltransferase
MRYAVIIAGGSGTRLWPMSRAATPKQLIPLIGGQSLLEIAVGRLERLLPPERCFVCAGQAHAEAIARALPRLGPQQFFGEPCGRDTLNAIGFSAAVIARHDPEALIGVFTADHVIEPADRFRAIVDDGYAVVERHPQTLLTFGIAPTGPATDYGYLELGEAFDGSARRLRQFREKPDLDTARQYVAAGPERFLWNSGMFVWRADTLLDCIRRYAPDNHAGLVRIADAWDGPRRQAVLAEVYPTLKRISVDYAVMEPASRDATVTVAAIPMPLRWLDVGSWPAFAETCPHDQQGNALGTGRTLLLDTRGTLAVSSDPNHLIATIGCENLLIVHTPDATLICRADRADEIKELHGQVSARYGPDAV